jgi:hypothetical protein
MLPLFAASGCLYLDNINHPPTIALEAAVKTYKGVPLDVDPMVGDPDDGPGNVHVDLTISALDGPVSDCDYTSTPYGRTFQVTFYRTGTFQIALTATDDHGSPSGMPAIETVTVLDALPAFSSTSMITQANTGDACNLNTAGDAIPLALAGPPSDADADAHLPGCSATDVLAYTWRISAQPSGTKPVLTLYDKQQKGCTPVTATSTTTLMVIDPTVWVCLWTDPMIAGSTAAYNVVFDVTDDPSDPTHTVTSPSASISVGPDQPPCITGTNPVAGSYVVDRTVLQEFDIDGAVDDRDPFGSANLTFAWSVWRDSDPTWRDVPSWTQSTYQLDVSSFDVGEHVRVRAEAVDRTGARVPPSSCPIDADDCQVASCASLPDVCHKWKTWDLELR